METKFSCPWCPVETPWQDVFKIHLQYGHMNKMWLCQCNSPAKCPNCAILCRNASKLRGQLESILERKRKKKGFSCPSCLNFKTSTSTLLNAHNVLCHTLECGLCNYFAQSKDNLNVHIRTHYSKPFQVNSGQNSKSDPDPDLEESTSSLSSSSSPALFIDGQFVEVQQRSSRSNKDGEKLESKSFLKIPLESENTGDSDVHQVFLCQVEDCSFGSFNEKKLALHYNNYHHKPIVLVKQLKCPHS